MLRFLQLGLEFIPFVLSPGRRLNLFLLVFREVFQLVFNGSQLHQFSFEVQFFSFNLDDIRLFGCELLGKQLLLSVEQPVVFGDFSHLIRVVRLLLREIQDFIPLLLDHEEEVFFGLLSQF